MFDEKVCLLLSSWDVVVVVVCDRSMSVFLLTLGVGNAANCVVEL